MAAADQAMTSDAPPGSSAGPEPHGPVRRLDADGLLCVALAGRLDALRALTLRAELDQLVAAAAGRVRGVLVDLSDVVFLDSAALAALVRLRRQCAQAVLDLELVRPRHADALRIFSLTQFDEVFVMRDSRP